MSERPQALQSEPLLATHEAVLRDGDPLDAMRPLFASTELKTFNALQGVTALWLTTSEQIGPHYALSYPVYAIGSIVLAKASKQISVRRSVRKSHGRETVQEALRKDLGEPVDLFRTGRKKGQHDTVLRWYGPDEVVQPDETSDHEESDASIDATTLNLSQRLTTLLDRIDQTPVKEIAFSTSWLTQPETAIDPSNYGNIVPGEFFVERLAKGNKRSAVVDLESVADVLITTPEKCRSLLADIHETTDGDARNYLITRITAGDVYSKVPALYAQWLASPSDPILTRALTRHIQAEVERELSNNLMSEPTIEKDELGVIHKIPTHSTVMVRENGVSQFDSYSDRTTGQGVIRHQGTNSLLTHFNVPSAEELVKQILDIPDDTKAAVSAKAALLLLLSRRESAPISSPVQLQTGLESSALGLTLLQRAQYDSPFLSSRTQRKADKAGESLTIAYPLKNRYPVRALKKVGALALVLAVGGGIGFGLYQANNASLLNREAAFKTKYNAEYYQNDDLYNRFIASERPWYETAYIDAMDGVQSKQEDAERNVTNIYKGVGLTQILQKINLLDMYNMSFPGTTQPSQTPYTHSNGNNIGDAPQDGNKAVYTITPYNGADPKGYWATEVDNSLTINTTFASGYPFSNADLGFESTSNICTTAVCQPFTLPVTPGDKQKVLYKVTTPYIGNTYDSNMPIKNGTSVIAAVLEFTDSTGKLKSVAPKVRQDPATGTYLMEYQPGNVGGYGDSATLTYWLAASSNIIHASGTLQVPDSIVNMSEVVKTTKQYLGLPANATEAEISAKIKAKRYSFTPFSDSARPAVTTNFSNTEKDNTNTLLLMAKSLAGLPSVNCNIAATDYLLATNGRYKNHPANLVGGFHNMDDNILSTGELHAWVTDSAGAIVDNTPSSSDPSQKRPVDTVRNTDNTMTELLHGGEASILIAAAWLTLYKRRRKILTKIGDIRDKAVLDGKHTSRAITVLNHAQWSSDTSQHFDIGKSDEPWIATAEQTPVISRIHTLPDMDYKEAKRLLVANNITVAGPVRRAIKSVLSRRTKLLDLHQRQVQEAASKTEQMALRSGEITSQPDQNLNLASAPFEAEQSAVFEEVFQA